MGQQWHRDKTRRPWHMKQSEGFRGAGVRGPPPEWGNGARSAGVSHAIVERGSFRMLRKRSRAVNSHPLQVLKQRVSTELLAAVNTAPGVRPVESDQTSVQLPQSVLEFWLRKNSEPRCKL